MFAGCCKPFELEDLFKMSQKWIKSDLDSHVANKWHAIEVN